MKRFFFPALALTPLLLFTAAPLHAAPALQVVTSTTDLASLVKQIGGEAVSVESICAGDQDPHFIQARPSFMRSLADADLFVRIGLDLERAWEEPLLRGSRNSKVQIGNDGHLDLSTNIRKLGLPSGSLDRSMGDVHALGNPHYWLDPYNGRIMAIAIAERLTRLAPAHAAAFASNRDRFLKTLDGRMFGNGLVERFGGDKLWQLDNDGQLDTFLSGQGATNQLGGWRAQVPRLAKTPLVTFHKSWSYFAQRFRVPVVAQLEPKPGIPPSPGHLLGIIKAIRAQGVRLIIIEPYYDRKVAEFVSKKTNIPVRVIANATGGAAGTDDYLAMLDQVFQSILNHAN